jgi:hypothetical protein
MRPSAPALKSSRRDKGLESKGLEIEARGAKAMAISRRLRRRTAK